MKCAHDLHWTTAAIKRVLSRNGIAEFSTSAVCREAKITSPTLYHHFQDKTEVLNALVDLAAEEFF
jgi:AcrR family transcriptional regulator